MSWLRVRYRPVLGIILLPSLALIGAISYYPAVRSLIGGFYQCARLGRRVAVPVPARDRPGPGYRRLR